MASPPQTPTSAASAPGGTAPKSADTPDEAARKEVVRQLRGPVALAFKGLMPELAPFDDPYKAVMGNAELLDRCFKVFQTRRDAFAAFLVDAQGAAVSDDAARLACGRSINEVTGMAVRSGMRAFAEQHFGDAAKAAPVPGLAKTPAEAERAGWIAAIAGMFRQRNTSKGAPPPKPAPGGTAVFYPAIRDYLDFPWQVAFFPVYVEIPAELFQKLGHGITRLDNADKLRRLAQLANEDIAKAEQVMGDPALAKEMLENNVLAAESVSQMSAAEFKMVHEALASLDVKQKWDIFANKLTALLVGQDKRISKADIAALASQLGILNEHAVRLMFDLELGREQFASFLETAAKALGKALYTALFGPIPSFGADETATRKQKTYINFVEKTLRSLVEAVKALKVKFKRDAPEVISECLALVCEARRDGIAAELRGLAPALEFA